MKDATQYVDEESELCPVSLYAETKVAVERALLQSGQPWLVSDAVAFCHDLRCITKNALRLDRKRIHHGNADQEAPQGFRGTILASIHTLCMTPPGQFSLVLSSPVETVGGYVFNVGATDQNFQKQQLVDMIRPYAPDAVVEFVHKTEDPRDYRVSFARITNQLGFKTTRRVPQGIAEVARLVKENVVANLDDRKYRN